MNVSEIDELMKRMASEPAKEELQLALSLVDYTSLEGNDTREKIVLLSQRAINTGVAAVCVYPSLVATAKKELHGKSVKVASVAGAFPSGQLPLHLRLEEARYAISEGADEIDMVISRGKFLEGEHQFVFDEIAAFREVCVNQKLKVILEVGELETLENIKKASDIAIEAGADFIKTSTGKIGANASLTSVYVMLMSIKEHFEKQGKKIGIKPSGGIVDGIEAVKYLRLTALVLGKEWLQPDLFRFGASRLVNNLLREIEGETGTKTAGDGY